MSASCGSALRMATARPYRFYASEISYFSGKVRPALRAKRVPCEEVLPTRTAYREVIRARHTVESQAWRWLEVWDEVARG